MNREMFFCLVGNREIGVYDCFDISFVAEGLSPDSYLPDWLPPEEFTNERKEICLKCEYHPK
jgi:hypothetical protein